MKRKIFNQLFIQFFILVLFYCFEMKSYAQISVQDEYNKIPIRLAISSGLSTPVGGSYLFSEKPDVFKGFNVLKTHNPGVTLAFFAECPWNDNWFMFDSLYVGTRITTQYFFAKNINYNENLWINTFYFTFSRSFNVENIQPYARIGIGGSTLKTSLNAFVLSGGGSVSLGSRFYIDNHQLALETTINAPLIAYRNKLTAFWELSLLYILKYDYLKKTKAITEPSYKY
jgi:hypothetical protein